MAVGGMGGVKIGGRMVTDVTVCTSCRCRAAAYYQCRAWTASAAEHPSLLMYG